jgi:hypothetical protein
MRTSMLGAAEGTLMTIETEASWWPVSSQVAVVVGRGTIIEGTDIGVVKVDVDDEVELVVLVIDDEDEVLDTLVVELVGLDTEVEDEETGQVSARLPKAPGFPHPKVAISL